MAIKKGSSQEYTKATSPTQIMNMALPLIGVSQLNGYDLS